MNGSGIEGRHMKQKLFEDLTRRTLLAGGAGLCALTTAAKGLAKDKAAGKPASPFRLRYLQPAARWDEALPIGNGRLGAMVFGRVGQERLQLNEDTLWAGGP